MECKISVKEVFYMKCIYAIHNTITDLYYIGSTTNFSKRKTGHFTKLRKGNHSNSNLQKDFNEFGESAFKVFILKEVKDDSKLKELEEYYIGKFSDRCYNKYLHCNTLNESARKKISLKCSGSRNGNFNRPHTEEEKQRIRDNRFGVGYVCKPKKSNYVRKTPEELAESRKRMSAIMKGRHVSEETREKLRQYRKGRKASDEVRKKMSENRKGRKNSNSKLTKEQVLEIHERMNNGEHYSVICSEFNIGQTQAYKIKRKEHWVFNG